MWEKWRRKAPMGAGGSSHSPAGTKYTCAFLETFSGGGGGGCVYHFVKTLCDQRCLYSVTIETRTECFHWRRRLKRTIRDSGLNSSAKILKLFYSCSFKNKFLICTGMDIHIHMYTHRKRIIFFPSVRCLRRIQNKKHFEIASLIFLFSEQFKIEYGSQGWTFCMTKQSDVLSSAYMLWRHMLFSFAFLLHCKPVLWNLG